MTPLPHRFAVASLTLAACLAVPALTSSADATTGPTHLTVQVTWEPGLTATWTLDCDPPGGTHPNAKRACARLAAIPRPFSKAPTGMACTMVYGGPQEARVTGTWQGARVAKDFSRTDGCQIALWQQYRPLLRDPSSVIVRGRVDLGPTCPVQRPDETCETLGAPATVTATSGARRRTVASAADGFALRLPRRVWSLTADAGMRCPVVRVDLRSGAAADAVIIGCDTGIRSAQRGSR
jgi:hypothetical protein